MISAGHPSRNCDLWGGPHKLDKNWSQLRESRAGWFPPAMQQAGRCRMLPKLSHQLNSFLVVGPVDTCATRLRCAHIHGAGLRMDLIGGAIAESLVLALVIVEAQPRSHIQPRFRDRGIGLDDQTG